MEHAGPRQLTWGKGWNGMRQWCGIVHGVPSKTVKTTRSCPVILTWLMAVALAADPQPLGPGDHTRTLQVDGRERSYLVHVPAKYGGKQPTPVVLAFHGGGSNAEQMVRFCGLNEKADKEGFLAVYPSGTGRFERMLTWNAGNCCGYAMQNKVDDVAFTRALLDDLAEVANVDPKRVYATGMSNGAIMCYRLASQLSDRIAAIAPVAGQGWG
jgi:polyhydroxybutyrate depolymerase